MVKIPAEYEEDDSFENITSSVTWNDSNKDGATRVLKKNDVVYISYIGSDRTHSTTGAEQIATLPVGARPKAQMVTVGIPHAGSNASLFIINIFANGEIKSYSTDSTSRRICFCVSFPVK